MWMDVFMLKLGTLLETVIGNLAHIMLTFKRGLAHVTKRLLGFPCSHILATCHCRAIDFQQFVQDYTTHVYLSTWAPLFYPIFDELD